MEQRLIELDKVLELIETCNSDGLTGIFCSYQDGKRFEQLLIKHIPTVEPIKSEWIGEQGYPICKKCGCNIYEKYISCSDYAEIIAKMDYCPNCGADMRGGKE